jgi:pimeloyl-ACP methyl ester carboxylesterase
MNSKIYRLNQMLRCGVIAAFIAMVAERVTAAPAPEKESGAATNSAGETKSFVVKVTGQGKPMLLIPGLTCGGDVWNGTVDHFKDRYECHVLTLAGFAGQPAIAPPMMETIRKDIAAYIRARKLDHPVLIGHSLGGFLVFWVGSSEPDLVGPIVAVDGLPFYGEIFNPGATAETSKPMAESMRQAMAGQSQEEFAEQNRRFIGNMITDSKNLELIAPTCAKSDPKAVGNAMYDLMTTDLRPDIAKIKTPVLLIGAGGNFPTAESLTRGKATYESQVAKIPNHRVVFAEKSKHFIMLDAPDFLFSAVDDFLANRKQAR